MKVLAVYVSELIPPFFSVGDRIYRNSSPRWDVWVQTDCGVIHMRFDSGFESDGRSGPKLVDYFLPNTGTPEVFVCWLFHDGGFYDIGLSFETLNDILQQMLDLAGIPEWKANVVEFAVSKAGQEHFGKAVGAWEKANEDKIHLEWIDKVPRHALFLMGEP